MAGSALDSGAWAASVHAERDPALIATLAERQGRRAPIRSVSVTELVDVRSAYWRAIAPIEPTPERRAILAAGREQHVRIGHEIAPARFREVRVQREGIVGQIDLLEERPTELKTTASPPDLGTLRTSRPAYLEQLAMYCALVGVPEGRLVLIAPSAVGGARVSVYHGRFGSLDRIWEEMVQRAGRLRTALSARDPSGLPRCPWRDRGCEYQAAEACDCAGSESPGTTVLLDELEELTPDASAAAHLEERLAAGTSGPPPAARRFHDLVYPRRAYFERTVPESERPPGAPRWTPSSSPDDLYRVLADLLESGPSGELTREPTLAGEPLETVTCLRGDPVLLKVSRAWRPSSAPELLSGQPQYFLELGFRCAALGRSEGWLLLGYERAETWADKVAAFRFRFDPVEPISRLFDERRRNLHRAIEVREPASLPACASWMVDSCDYRSRCGCGGPAATGRENR